MARFKKLNNSGMTIIEILLCFIIVVGICLSLFTTLNNYQIKENKESDRTQILKYKNLLEKTIYDDLIKKTLISVDQTILDNDFKGKSCNDKWCRMEKYTFTFKDGSQKFLILQKKIASYIDENSDETSKYSDDFLIEYGSEGNMIKYPLPDLGHSTDDAGLISYDFKINNIFFNTNNQVMNLYIGFYHPYFERMYGINLVCPLGYK